MNDSSFGNYLSDEQTTDYRKERNQEDKLLSNELDLKIRISSFSLLFADEFFQKLVLF